MVYTWYVGVIAVRVMMRPANIVYMVIIASSDTIHYSATQVGIVKHFWNILLSFRFNRVKFYKCDNSSYERQYMHQHIGELFIQVFIFKILDLTVKWRYNLMQYVQMCNLHMLQISVSVQMLVQCCSIKCIKWDVKPYTLTHSNVHKSWLRSQSKLVHHCTV